LLEPRAQLGPLLDALEDEPEHEAAQLRALPQRLTEEAPERIAALGKRRQREHLLRRPARDVLDHALRDAQQQLLLRPEVPEDGALRDADLVGEEIERHAVDATRGEEAERRFEDRLLGAHSALLPRPRRSRNVRIGMASSSRSPTRHN